MIRCLVRIISFGRQMYPEQSASWLFPALSGNGHIVEHKERREQLSHWGNELRQTYRTLGQVADVNDIDMHLLMNHSLPGVNAGYITRGKLVSGHLRAAQQKISNTVMSAIRSGEGASTFWPLAPMKHVMAAMDERQGWTRSSTSRT